MPNITNVVRAFNEISQESKAHKGELNLDKFMSFFNFAVGKYNLKEDQIIELKAMKYPVEVIVTSALDELTPEIDDSCPGAVEPTGFLSLSTKIEALEEHIKNLTGALAKIGTLTGNGNHLREFKIDRWEPTKKDMNKYRS